MICRGHKTAQKFSTNLPMNIVLIHHFSQSPLHLLSNSKETTSILTEFQHTGHICCHASCHQGHGLALSPVYKKVFHSSRGFHIPCRNSLKRQVITFSTFLLFNLENVHHGFIVKECHIQKVLVNTHNILMRNSNYIVKLLGTCIYYVMYLLKGKRVQERIRLSKYFLKSGSFC